jgi:dTDP-4-amino-4,6-dideoxygalactose transaminase
MAADETPVADRLATSVIVIRIDPDLGLQGLDEIAETLREAVTA